MHREIEVVMQFRVSGIYNIVHSIQFIVCVLVKFIVIFLACTFIKHHLILCLIMYEVCQIDGTLPNWYTTTKFGGYWRTCKFMKRNASSIIFHIQYFILKSFPCVFFLTDWLILTQRQLTCQMGPLHTHLPAMLSLGNLPCLITPFIGSAPFGRGDVVCQAMG